MDDANLSKLVVNQPGLKPDFKKETLNYEITVASNVTSLSIVAETSDKGASFSIKSNSGYGDECKLNEGENKIQIECTSEDGTIKKYHINCLKLSASEAKLDYLELNQLVLKPTFEPNIFEYETKVIFSQKIVELKPSSIDPNCGVEISCNSKIIENVNDWFICTLNYGFSDIQIKLTSPNKTKEQIYKILINRGPLPMISSFTSIRDRIEFEDPISLVPSFRPAKVIFDKIVINYSLPFLNFFQKVSFADDLLNFISLSAHDSLNYPKSLNLTLENKLSDAQVRVPYMNGKFSADCQLKVLSDNIEEINKDDQILTSDDIKKYVPNHADKMIESLPPYQIKTWEKFLQIIYDETDADKLIQYSDDHLATYINSITKLEPETIVKNSGNDGSPLYFLNMSIFNLATSFKFKSRSFETHLKLAFLLEEKNFYENIYGPDIKDNNLNALTLSSQNKIASDSSKEEEILAICIQRNHGPHPTDAQKLKALDEEYHYLIGSGQNVKAEYIQLLYQFKAKKISTNPTQANTKLNETGDYLLKANFKYLDAMSLVLESKHTNFLLNFLVGRSFCMLGDFLQAMIYLKSCLDWSDVEKQTLAKFYFAFAMSKTKHLINDNSKVIISYLSTGLQLFLANLSTSLSNRSILFSNDYFSLLQPIFLEGFLILGRLKYEYFEKSTDFISAEDAFRYCAWLSCIALDEISSRTVIDSQLLTRSVLIQNIYKILIDSHIQFISNNFNSAFMLMNDSQQLDLYRTLQSKQCTCLLNLIHFLPSYKNNEEYLKHIENIAQILVFSNPLESYNLIQLGFAKLELYDYLVENKKEPETYLNELIEDCKNLLIVSVEILNGKLNDDNIPPVIQNQKWWLTIVNSIKIKIKSSLSKPEPPAIPVPVNKAQVTAKNAPLKASSKITPPANTAINKKGPVAIPKASPAQKAATRPVSSKPEPKTSITDPTTAAKVVNETDTKIEEISSIFLKFSKKPAAFDTNIIYIQAQLYLARVYSRLKDFQMAKTFYEKAIEKEPKKHDAYIELANMLRSNEDIPGAIDVYSNFPVDSIIKENKELSYDDAFIFGELVNLLNNTQKYDDPRLVKYLILWAQVMGIGTTDKYIAILDKANKTSACKQVYAGVHKKQLTDPDLNQFFKFKGWL